MKEINTFIQHGYIWS